MSDITYIANGFRCQDIVQLAIDLDLDIIGTGGGVDYPYKKLRDGKSVILNDAYCLESLSEETYVTVFNDSCDDDESWYSGIQFPVNSAEQGLYIMAAMESFNNG